jgi:hypothetical protein
MLDLQTVPFDMLRHTMERTVRTVTQETGQPRYRRDNVRTHLPGSEQLAQSRLYKNSMRRLDRIGEKGRDGQYRKGGPSIACRHSNLSLHGQAGWSAIIFMEEVLRNHEHYRRMPVVVQS